MKRIIKLNEGDIKRIVNRVLREQDEAMGGIKECFEGVSFKVPAICNAADGQKMCLEALKKQILEAPVEIGEAIACVMSKMGKGGETGNTKKGIRIPGYGGGHIEI